MKITTTTNNNVDAQKSLSVKTGVRAGISGKTRGSGLGSNPGTAPSGS